MEVNPSTFTKVDFKYFLQLAIHQEMSWAMLGVLLNNLTPTLDKSKQLIKILLKELQAAHSRPEPVLQGVIETNLHDLPLHEEIEVDMDVIEENHQGDDFLSDNIHDEKDVNVSYLKNQHEIVPTDKNLSKRKELRNDVSKEVVSIDDIEIDQGFSAQNNTAESELFPNDAEKLVSDESFPETEAKENDEIEVLEVVKERMEERMSIDLGEGTEKRDPSGRASRFGNPKSWKIEGN